MTEKTLLLLDGHSLAFRSFFALPADAFRTDQGQYTNAVHGFTNTLLKLYGDHQPTHVAVAFDLPGGTFRTRKYTEYKGGRDETPEKFKGQISVIQEVLDALGITWITVEDYEADDIVATLSQRGKDAGMRVYVASGDKDSFQLIDDATTVLYPMPRSQMLIMTADVVEERHGVRPERYSDLAALVGEDADNLPGVPGVGPKTAQKWLAKYTDLNGILDHANEIGGKVGQNLRENVDQVRLNRELNELVRDLPIVPDLDQLIPAGVDRERVHELFDTLDFSQLRPRVLTELPQKEGSAPVEDSPHREPEYFPATTTAFSDFRAKNSGPWAIDIDGNTAPGQGKLARFAVAANSGAVFYADYAELDENEEKSFAEFLADPAESKIGHGTKGIWHALRSMGLELDGVTGDTELMAYLLHPDQRAYDVNDLSQRYLGRGIDVQESDTLAISPDGTSIVKNDLATRAVALLDLHDSFREELAKQGPAEELLVLELQVGSVLATMEDRGIAIDQDRLNNLWKDFDARVNTAAARAHGAIGDDSVNLSSPKQLQGVLFDTLNLPKTKRTKSGYTTNADALTELLQKIAFREDEQARQGQEFLTGLFEHRDAIKLRQSVEGLQKAVQADQRIHTTYQQTRAATGRLSSTDPNLQNIHARTAEGRQIRGVFVPGEGYDLLMTADYSQIEMRIMAHLSGDQALIDAFNDGADLHTFVAGRVFGIAQEEVTSDQRSRIKAMSYGLVYGLSAYGLSQQLHVPVPEAQRLMDDYFERFGKVKDFLDGLVDQARKLGYTETILGRRRYLPDLNSTNRQLREATERMALNAPIQGSAADIIKIAMCNVESKINEAGLTSRVLLQVHDELVLEVVATEREAVENIVREEMGNAFELSVPLSVGVGVGSDWQGAAH